MIPLRDANPTHRRPIVTLAIAALCGIAFAWELGVMADGGEAALAAFLGEHGVVPAQLSPLLAGSVPAAGAFLDVLTSMFLHGGWLHLGGNLLYLWIFGNNVEDRLGHLPFLLFYLFGGFVAALTQVAIAPESEIPLIGASGAIAATLGAYLVFFPGARVVTLIFLGFFYQLVRIPAVIVLGFWFVLQLIDGFGSLGVGVASGGGVAFFAHIGGFVAGALIALLVGRGPSPPRTATLGRVG